MDRGSILLSANVEDKLGFWAVTQPERARPGFQVRGYSNTADPWTEDRFS